jgi:GNAT superfamily N-acetyltransferase
MNYDLWVSHITTPYLPVIGLVHPDCVRPESLVAVVQSLQTGIRPDFDKSNRWGNENSERLVDKWFVQTDESTMIFTTRIDIVTAYIYTSREEPLNAFMQYARKMGATKIYTFSHVHNAKKAHASHGFLGEVKKQSKISLHVRQVRCDKQEFAELRALDNGKEMAGLAFLASQIATRDDIGPTFGYFNDSKLVGVIGPLDISADVFGHNYLLPPYFGVHASMRGKGAGRELWNAAMNYAADQGAEYVLVQAEDGVASEVFYRKLAFQDMGRILQLQF